MGRNLAVTWLVLGVLATACSPANQDEEAAARPSVPATSDNDFPEWALGLIPPLKSPQLASSPAADAQVALGRALYNETLLSKDRDVSCNSCHPLSEWGTASRLAPSGVARCNSRLDIPSVYNAAVEVDLFWDGRAHSVEEQARESIRSPLEMAMPDESTAVARLKASGKYAAAFRAAFPQDQDPLTFANIARALGAFERGLVTPSRWDEFLGGNKEAVTPQEKQGFATFVNKGCSDCHNGMAVGGRMYQVAGEVRPWPLQSDSGRFAATHEAEDLFVFRVPPLRNIEKTGPYFDTGVITDLAEAVRLMARYQRGINLSEEEVGQIVAWLRTLTGTIPSEYVTPRGLASSGH